ncbi:MAG: hypothetical protein IJZ74_04725 [Clostridia bacterium]|nr:hypothetical protein [Clostridia bacterium]
MKNAILRLSALLTAVCLLAGIPLAYAADGFDYAYTYTYDYWGDQRQSPDAYRTRAFLTSADLGLDKQMVNPQSLFVQGNTIYIVDTGNNRIIQLETDGTNYTISRIIDSFTGDTEPLTFNGPSDIYVDDEGTMYIADTNNNRIVKLDKDLNYLLSFTKPVDPTFDQSMSYLPTKMVADVSGRVFALAQNVNKGLIKYEADGTFTGFIGASPVKYTWYELIWRLLSTKEQRAQQVSFVPTEYDNIAIDEKGFFYVVTQTFDENELMGGGAEPVRRLNSLGTNILIENGNWWVVGDVQWAAGNTTISRTGPSKFVDITVLDNDIYVVLDETHNRLFGYDHQGNMLWAFGGLGNAVGYFNKPSSIEHMGYDLLVLDSQAAALTIMTPTNYGQQIYNATEQYDRGEYDVSAATWLEVLKQNGNYDLAYIGIGRAKLQQGEYKEACDYFKMARDDKNYSEAFRYYRSELVEKNIGWIFGIAAIVLVVPMIVGRIRKIKEEVDNA